MFFLYIFDIKDPYFFGKEVAAMGRLALIADELGDNITSLNIRNNMIKAIDPWFHGNALLKIGYSYRY